MGATCSSDRDTLPITGSTGLSSTTKRGRGPEGHKPHAIKTRRGDSDLVREPPSKNRAVVREMPLIKHDNRSPTSISARRTSKVSLVDNMAGSASRAKIASIRVVEI